MRASLGKGVGKGTTALQGGGLVMLKVGAVTLAGIFRMNVSLSCVRTCPRCHSPEAVDT